MIVVHKVAIIEMAVQNDLKPEWGILFIEEQLPEIALQDIVNSCRVYCNKTQAKQIISNRACRCIRVLNIAKY